MEGFINSKIVSQKTWLQDAVGEAEKCIGANHKYTDLDNAKKEYNAMAAKLKASILKVSISIFKSKDQTKDQITFSKLL